MNKYNLDHLDIVTCHICNKNCKHCIDKFLGTYKDFITLDTIENFLKIIRGDKL